MSPRPPPLSRGHGKPSSLPPAPPVPPVPGPVGCGCAWVPAASMCLSADHSPFVPYGFRENLFTRTLSDIVNKEDFVLDSEYLITLLVIVPK